MNRNKIFQKIKRAYYIGLLSASFALTGIGLVLIYFSTDQMTTWLKEGAKQSGSMGFLFLILALVLAYTSGHFEKMKLNPRTELYLEGKI